MVKEQTKRTCHTHPCSHTGRKSACTLASNYTQVRQDDVLSAPKESHVVRRLLIPSLSCMVTLILKQFFKSLQTKSLCNGRCCDTLIVCSDSVQSLYLLYPTKTSHWPYGSHLTCPVASRVACTEPVCLEHHARFKHLQPRCPIS